MIVHEMATNAAKYGALSNDSGTVAPDWEVITENAKPKFENDMVGGRRPSRRRPGAARFRIAVDRAQRARPARRRSYRRFPAARGGHDGDLRADERELEATSPAAMPVDEDVAVPAAASVCAALRFAGIPPR